MKLFFHKIFAGVLPIVGVSILLTGHCYGQTFKTLFKFSGVNGESRPQDSLTLSGNTFYGTTQGDYFSGILGAVFALSIDGTNFTNLQSFSGGQSKGSPAGGVILSGNMLYGSTE